MNRVIHFKQTEDSKVLMTSDTHLRHNNPNSGLIWKNRGYANSESHTNAVIDGINARCRPMDKLLHFGDFCLNTNESELNEILSRIVCQNIYMVWGNHNNPLWRVYQDQVKKWLHSNDEGYNTPEGGTPHVDGDIEIYPFRWRNVVFIGNYVEFTVDGKYFIGSHYPMYVFNYMKDNANHVCGHSHYNLELSQADNETSKILDVGWDGWGKPLTLDEVLAVMNKKQALVVDHHAKGGVKTWKADGTLVK